MRSLLIIISALLVFLPDWCESFYGTNNICAKTLSHVEHSILLWGGLNVWEITTTNKELFSTASTLVRLECSKDPRICIDSTGKQFPYALMHSDWMRTILRGHSETTEHNKRQQLFSLELSLAADCLQLNNWKIPRKMYPQYFKDSSGTDIDSKTDAEDFDFLQGRDAYFSWKASASQFVASRAAYFIREAGLSDAEIDSVKRFLLIDPFDYFSDNAVKYDKIDGSEEADVHFFAMVRMEALLSYGLSHLRESYLNELLWYDLSRCRNYLLPRKHERSQHALIPRSECLRIVRRQISMLLDRDFIHE